MDLDSGFHGAEQAAAANYHYHMSPYASSAVLGAVLHIQTLTPLGLRVDPNPIQLFWGGLNLLYVVCTSLSLWMVVKLRPRTRRVIWNRESGTPLLR